MALKNLEREYVLGELELYREFDNSHFIANAKTAVTGKIQAVNLKMKFDYYSSMLEKAIADFSAVNIEKDSIDEFLTHINSMPRLDAMNYTICDIDQMDVTTFKPQYLAQYTNMVQVIIDKVIQGSITDDEVTRIISGEFPERVERQVVKTTLRYGVNPKDLVLNSCSNKVQANTTYIRTKVIPFITSYQNLKETTITEANALLNAIKETESTLKAMHFTIEKIKASGNLDFDKLQKLNQVSYNALHGMIEIISYVTFMMIRKMNSISSKAIACEKLYNDITNLYPEEDVSEGVTDKMVFATDTNSLADALLNGRADSYSTMASNIFGFYNNMPNVDMIEEIPVFKINSSDEFMNKGIADQTPRMLDKFEDIAKAYLSISTGLDVIGSEGDEYLMIFDDIMDKSGFAMPIETRFKTEIENIKDMSDYKSELLNNSDKNMVFRALTEVKNYGDNIQIIANIIAEVYKKIKYLGDRFARNVNTEYKDTETVNELKLFLTSLLENFEDMTRTISKNFYDRLVSLGHVLSDLTAKDKVPSLVMPSINDSHDTIDSIDFTEMAFESILHDREEYNDLIFRALESSYYIERARALRGVNVILEAEQKPSVTTNTNTNTNTTGKSTKVTVQDNNAEANEQKQSSGALSRLKANIAAFIDNLTQSFKNITDKYKNKNSTWMDQHKDGLMNRSYSNVTVNILPYHNISADDIVTDIGKLTTNVKTMTPQTLQGLNTKDDLYKKLFAFVQGEVKESKGPLGEQFTKYYKVGTAELTTVPISNSELKRQVTTVMIPYCENYADKYQESVSTALNGLGKTVDDMVKSYGGGEENKPVNESVSIFMEETTNNKNTEGNISERANWMREAVKDFSGAVLNAIRDRYQDYLKALDDLKPKVTKQKDTNNEPNGNQVGAVPQPS